MKPIYVNIDDYKEKFWNKNYLVRITSQGIKFIVNANCLQEAVDYIIDYCQDEMPGMVDSYQNLLDEGYSEVEIEDFPSGGNEGLYLTTHNIFAKVIR